MLTVWPCRIKISTSANMRYEFKNNNTMKTNLTWLPLFLLLLAGSSATAQHANESVFWVVEVNVKKPDYTIIKFYNTQRVLLKEERISGKFLDIRKEKTRQLL